MSSIGNSSEFTGKYKLECSGVLQQRKKDLLVLEMKTVFTRVASRKYFLIYIKIITH